MRCSECHLAINFYGEDVTVTVIYRDGHAASHCHHRPFNENDLNIIAILGSKSCLRFWMKKNEQHAERVKKWMDALQN